jgi:N-acetylmuramoyl-L-alanine amidase
VKIHPLRSCVWSCCLLAPLATIDTLHAQSLPSLSSPAVVAQVSVSGRVTTWKFDSSDAQLELRTSGGVQPRAQLISNPTRLVIDLPGITLGRPPVNQPLGKSFRVLKLGQFDRQTARMVIELDPGYTLDPKKIRFRGLTPTHWVIQLPQPQRLSADAVTEPTTPDAPPSRASEPPAPTRPPSRTSPSSPAATQVQSLRVTRDGFFIRTSGSKPRFRTQYASDRRQVTLIVDNATLSSQFGKRDVIVGKFGVNRALVSQTEGSPPAVLLTLLMNSNSSKWDGRVTGFRNLDGIAFLPVDRARPSIAGNPRSGGTGTSEDSGDSGELATIEAIELEDNQLLIRANQPLQYTSGWDRSTGAYRINLSGRLAPGVQVPPTGANTPLLRLQLRAEPPNTVALLVYPASGVRIGELSQPDSEEVALELGRSRTPNPLIPPSETNQAISVPPPESMPSSPAPSRPIVVPPPSNPAPSRPQSPPVRGRYVVMVDPGHGGPDVGAVGIGGLREKDITTDISRQVASLLERQGIQAVLTRPDDRDLDLEPRVQYAKQLNATIFVSIHANAISMSRPDINGLETYYYSSGERLARVVHRNILQGTGVRDRGVRTARFYVLRRTTMPAILVETGFVTGQEDAARLSTANYRTLMAESITRGILEYLRGP